MLIVDGGCVMDACGACTVFSVVVCTVDDVLVWFDDDVMDAMVERRCDSPLKFWIIITVIILPIVRIGV